MKDWKTLSEQNSDYAWGRFYQYFNFNPGINEKDWPGIHTDKPFIKFSIENLWGSSYSESINTNFIQKAIDAFVEITKDGEEIYALDWQHECFYVNPRLLTPGLMADNESSIPVISFIPNGDYYIFMTEDFENVWFGHPWEKTITIVGNELINAFNKNKPLFLTED
jgi:hypothetical protein